MEVRHPGAAASDAGADAAPGYRAARFGSRQDEEVEIRDALRRSLRRTTVLAAMRLVPVASVHCLHSPAEEEKTTRAQVLQERPHVI